MGLEESINQYLRIPNPMFKTCVDNILKGLDKITSLGYDYSNCKRLIEAELEKCGIKQYIKKRMTMD